MTTATTAATATIRLFSMVVIMVMAVTATALMVITMIMVVSVAMTTAATFVAMMMVIGAMDVTVGDLFGSSGTHITNSDAKVQIHTRQRMVGINLDKVFGDFDHSHRTVTIIGIGNEGVTLSHFHAVKQFTRDALHQIVLIFAVGFRSRDIQFETVTDLTVIQGFFQTRNQETCAMQVNQRLTAFGAVQHVAGLVRNGIVEGNNAQMAYFHVRFPVLAPRQQWGVKKLRSAYRKKIRVNTLPPRRKARKNTVNLPCGRIFAYNPPHCF
jgi:hypothetical protein